MKALPALLVFASAAIAVVEAQPAAEKSRVPSKISYAGGQLRISALDTTLADVLAKVSALTGVKIDVPEGASVERLPVVELGPGPPRQILASLLSDSKFNYLIQASDSDPEAIHSVLVMPREKKSGSSYARAAAPPVRPEEPPAPESPVPAPPENVGAEASVLNPQPPPAQPDPAIQGAPPQPEPSSSTKPAPLTPPQNMNPQTINQQLQQMYQQRMQMIQQGQTAPPAAPANPGNK